MDTTNKFIKDYFSRMGLNLKDNPNKDLIELKKTLNQLRNTFPEHTAINGVWDKRIKLINKAIELSNKLN